MPNYTCHQHHPYYIGTHYLAKASCEISASTLKDFWIKGRKSAKKGIN